ncbi:hypothetical protein, partial [Sphingomonas sp.]|uniref:hypothetical protein n=1 Tax=Sphingomonas sp. TaxID=28214 RepID=UPI00286A01DE
MRTSLVFLLLASVAVPAFAADDPSSGDSERAARHEARAEARAERQAERAQQPEQSAPQAQARSIEPRHEDRPQIVQQQTEV